MSYGVGAGILNIGRLEEQEVFLTAERLSSQYGCLAQIPFFLKR